MKEQRDRIRWSLCFSLIYSPIMVYFQQPSFGFHSVTGTLGWVRGDVTNVLIRDIASFIETGIRAFFQELVPSGLVYWITQKLIAECRRVHRDGSILVCECFRGNVIQSFMVEGIFLWEHKSVVNPYNDCSESRFRRLLPAFSNGRFQGICSNSGCSMSRITGKSIYTASG